jgi:hypothetical protein
MSGGVAGERRCSVMFTVVPYADRKCNVGCAHSSSLIESECIDFSGPTVLEVSLRYDT